MNTIRRIVSKGIIVWFAVAVCVVVFSIAGEAWRELSARDRDNQLVVGFNQIRLLDKRDDVYRIMGAPDIIFEDTPVNGICVEADVSPNEELFTTVHYVTYRFFLPRTYVVVFDKNHNVVSKRFVD